MEPARLASTIKAAILVIVALAMATVAHAYEVSPMRIFLQPSRGQSSATIAVNNICTDSLPIEVKVLRRLVNPDGSQTFQPADDKFVIFPPQAQIAAGAERIRGKRRIGRGALHREPGRGMAALGGAARGGRDGSPGGSGRIVAVLVIFD